MNSEAKDIIKAIKELTKELKQIRRIMERRDNNPSIDEADPDKYIV